MLEHGSENNTLAQLNAAIAELQQKVNSLEQENASLKSALDDRESQLQDAQIEIIELQESLDRLSASEELFRTLFEISSAALYYTEVDPPCPVDLSIDEQCEWLYRNIRVAKANRAFAEMYGVENPDELIGLKNSDVHVEESDKNAALIRMQVENDYRIHNYETEEIDFQGRRRYFLNNGVGIIKEGYLIGAWASQIDITELREAQQALLMTEQDHAIELERINQELRQTLEQLAASEEGFRTLFEVSNEGIYSTEVDPPCPINLPIEEQCDWLYRNIRVTKANRAFAAMYGVDNPDDLIGIGNADVHVPDSEKNAAFIRGTIENGYRFYHLETEEIDRQGRLHCFLNSGAYTIKDGYIVAGWATQIDITELKETQQALLETEQKRVAELANANAEILEREREKTVLLSISQTIATVRDKSDLLKLIIEQVKPLLNFHDCNIPLIKDGKYFCHLSDLALNALNINDPGKKKYLYEAGFNRKEGTVLKNSSLESIMHEVEAIGHPVIIDYEQDWTKYSDASLPQAFQNLGYKEGLATVLKTGGEIHGCLIINSLQKSCFPSEQFSLFQAIADQVAVAISNILANEAVLTQERELQRIEQERANELERRVQERTAELNYTNALLDTLFEAAPVGFAFLDFEQRYVRINQALAKINGIDAQAHIGRTVQDVLPQMTNKVTEDLRQVAETKIPVVGKEICGETPAAPGQQRYWLASYYPIRAANQQEFGLGVIILEITERKQAELQLQQLSTQLEARVQERTTQLAQTVERLNDEIAERQQLAGEIHDTLAQTFTGISVQLELAQFLMHQNLAEVEAILDRIGSLTQTGLTEARRSVWALRTVSEDYADLVQNLSYSIETMTQGVSIRTDLIISGVPYLLPPFIGRNLLRIGQEAITNVLRHAQATDLIVELTYTEDEVVLRITDNGRGFLPQETGGGFGLLGMSERADRINGQLTITSQPGDGTEILASSPNTLH
ncbi:PAS domain S-box protein [Oscillatoria sp. FACHB-1407]|uniref:PAS domain S-box protein n=1 Tax=Oscillatoria sp. FACHB-1407 TaxID=2692847 RepID=UPI001689B92B|nr:PAS domain S-box protein [Oscillatoria sp. FACHB-1407]MBD2463014.1 PAS domain S-box protein [Oscillatoria sp. FACHB-1407]